MQPVVTEQGHISNSPEHRSLLSLDARTGDATLDQLVELVAWTCDVPVALLMKTSNAPGAVLAAHGVSPVMSDQLLTAGMDFGVAVQQGYEVVSDALGSHTWGSHPWVIGGMRFIASVALLSQNGECRGVLAIFDGKPRALSDHQARMLTALARLAADHLSLRDSLATISSLHEELEQAHGWLLESASQDDLTQIANRRALMAFLDKSVALARRERQPLSVLLLDLRDFKEINQSYGDATGDRVLREVATRLSACVRGSELVGRMSGDEFMAVLYPCDHDQALLAAGRYVKAVNERPIELGALGGASVSVQMATGVCTMSLPVSLTPDELYRQAAMALDSAKLSSQPPQL